MPRVSVVVPSCNEGEKLELTVRSLLESCSSSIEIVVVDNGSNDGCAEFLRRSSGPWDQVQLFSFTDRLGVAGARNTGAARASGEMLVFCDAHVLWPKGWDVPLLRALEDPAAGIVSPLLSGWPGQEVAPHAGQRWTGPRLHEYEWLLPASDAPHAVPLLCGAVQAFRRETFEWMGGYDGGMINWGSEDHEISLRCWLLGLEARSVPAVTARHYFRDAHTYPVGWYHVLYNELRLAYAHFGAERVSRVVAALAGFDGFERACLDVQASDIWDWRVAIDAQRVKDQDAWMGRFEAVV